MRKDTSVREWQINFGNGMYDATDFHTQCLAGWYDWFCKQSSLAAKTKKMGNIIMKIKDGGKINLDTMYVWFKNNCPACYPLYDDFRFADIETGNVQFTIQCGHPYGSEFLYEVYGRRNNFETALFKCKTSKQLVEWLNTPWKEAE